MYYLKNYEGVSPYAGNERCDQAYTGAISITKQLSQNYSLTLSHLFTSNDSNIDSYNYKRSITSAFYNVRF